MSKAEVWDSWIVLLQACVRQVHRAAAAEPTAEETRSECGLAITVMAFMLEAYLNLHVETVFPASIAKCLAKLPVPQQFQFYPRFAGAPAAYIKTWEADPIHNDIVGLFARRNKFAHGDVAKLRLREFTPANVTKLWNKCLDLMVLLEKGPAARIPSSRKSDFEDEIDSLRVVLDHQ